MKKTNQDKSSSSKILYLVYISTWTGLLSDTFDSHIISSLKEVPSSTVDTRDRQNFDNFGCKNKRSVVEVRPDVVVVPFSWEAYLHSILILGLHLC